MRTVYNYFEIRIDGDEHHALQTIEAWSLRLLQVQRSAHAGTPLDVLSHERVHILLGDQLVGNGQPIQRYLCRLCQNQVVSQDEWSSHVDQESKCQPTLVFVRGESCEVAFAIETLYFLWELDPEAESQKESVQLLWRVLSRHIVELFRSGIFREPTYMQHILDRKLLSLWDPTMEQQELRPLLTRRFDLLTQKRQQALGPFLPRLPEKAAIVTRTFLLTPFSSDEGSTMLRKLEEHILLNAFNLPDRGAGVSPQQRVTAVDLLVSEQFQMTEHGEVYYCMRCQKREKVYSWRTHKCGGWARIMFMAPGLMKKVASLETVLRYLRLYRSESVFNDMWYAATKHAFALYKAEKIGWQTVLKLVNLHLLHGDAWDPQALLTVAQSERAAGAEEPLP